MDKVDTSKAWKQRLLRTHVSLGLLVSFVMYISVFFGVFAIFIPYIQVWEKPSRHIGSLSHTHIDYEKMIEQVLDDPTFPKNNLLITLPGTMNESALKVSHRFAAPLYFNPLSGEKMRDEGKQSYLAEFLNELHYGKMLNFDKEWFGVIGSFFGRFLFGFSAVGVMSVVLSGVILIMLFSYKKSFKTPRALFSTLHVKIFTWTFLPFLMIVLSGAFMNLSLISALPMAKLISGGKESRIDAIIGPVLFPKDEVHEPLNESTPMLPIAHLMALAQKVDARIAFQTIRLINWSDKTAQVEFKGYDPYKPFLNGGVFNKPSVILSAVDGTLITHQNVLERSWSVFFAEATFFLHFLFGVDVISRICVALLMMASALALACGVLLWLEKEAKKFHEALPFYHWMSKIALSIMVGVLPATALLFVLQWLLPFEIHDRLLWQKGLFYNAWLATLFWAFYRLDSYRAAKEFLILGGALFMVASLLHLFHQGIVLAHGIFGWDLALMGFGSLLVYVGLKLPKRAEDIPLLWRKKEESV